MLAVGKALGLHLRGGVAAFLGDQYHVPTSYNAALNIDSISLIPLMSYEIASNFSGLTVQAVGFPGWRVIERPCILGRYVSKAAHMYHKSIESEYWNMASQAPD